MVGEIRSSNICNPAFNKPRGRVVEKGGEGGGKRKKIARSTPVPKSEKTVEYLRYRRKPLRAKILLITLERGQSVRS